MDYSTGIGNGAESVAFLSDGSFVVGGYTGAIDGPEINFKSSG